MATATADDVLVAWKTLWGTFGLSTLITGGIHHERPGQAADIPYAVVKVKGGPRDEQTEGCYNQPFEVAVDVYSINDETARRTIATALVQFDWTYALSVTNAVGLIWCKPMPESLTVDPDQHRGKDVAVTRMVWEVLLAQVGAP